MTFAHLAASLPQNVYQLEDQHLSPPQITRACLGWALEHYRFNPYRTTTKKSENLTQLVWPHRADRHWVQQHYEGIAIIRTLINTPAEDMGPRSLVKVAAVVADEFSANRETIIGKSLLKKITR